MVSQITGKSTVCLTACLTALCKGNPLNNGFSSQSASNVTRSWRQAYSIIVLCHFVAFGKYNFPSHFLELHNIFQLNFPYIPTWLLPYTWHSLIVKKAALVQMIVWHRLDNKPLTHWGWVMHICVSKPGAHFTNNFPSQFKCDGNFILLSSKY